MIVRETRLEDCPAIARVQVDSYRSAYASILPQDYLERFSYEEQAEDWRVLLLNKHRELLLVAEIEPGEIAGYILGRPGISAIPPYDSEIVALHVRQVYQRHGIGQALMAAMARRLKANGCAAAMLWVLAQNPTRAFYEKLGGSQLGERTIELDEHGTTAVETAYGWAAIDRLVEILTPAKS
jgi:ribosomal protein S18 acetylase RimI-like enzyme